MTTNNVIELGLTTQVVAQVGTGEWAVAEIGSLPPEFRAMAWTGSAVRIAQVTTEPVPEGSDTDVYKVFVGGIKIRCAATCKWPRIKREELRETLADSLKAGDHILRHPRFGRDALCNLAGHQRYETANLAQVKTAHEKVPLLALSVLGGGAILLGNGVFVG